MLNLVDRPLILQKMRVQVYIWYNSETNTGKGGDSVNYIVDLCAVLVLAASAGRGVSRGLVLSVGKLVTLAGGFAGAHMGASYLKGKVAYKIILPWIGGEIEREAGSRVNPASDVAAALARAGSGMEDQLVQFMESLGIPGFSLSKGWGRLMDRMTGTGSSILESAAHVVAERIAYVLIFIILFLVIELVMTILFTSMDGLKNLPVAGLANKLGGGAVGLASGVLVLWAVVAVLTLFMPSVTGSGGWLGPEVMERTVVAKKILQMVKLFLERY